MNPERLRFRLRVTTEEILLTGKRSAPISARAVDEKAY